MLSRRGKLVIVLFSIGSLVTLTCAIAYSLASWPKIWLYIAYGFLPFVGGLTLLSLGSLLGTLAKVHNPAISHLSKTAAGEPARNFLIGFLATGYVSLVRPPLVSNVPFLPYVEWTVMVFAVYVIYAMTGVASEESSFRSEGADWRRHSQKIRREMGRDLMRVTSAMERFVNQGVKEPLLIYVTLYLQRLGQTEEDIMRILSPLLDYQKDSGKTRFRFLMLPWTRRRIDAEDQERRELLLKTLLDRAHGVSLQ